MSICLTKEINISINYFKKMCESPDVTQTARECSDTKTASLLHYIFRFAQQFDLEHPLAGCILSRQGQTIHFESLIKALKPEQFDQLEKASLQYLRHLSTGWNESVPEVSEKFKASVSKNIETTHAVVLQKENPPLTIDSIVLRKVAKLQSECKVVISDPNDNNFSSKIVYICGEKEQINRFFEIVRSSLSYEPKSLLQFTMEVVSKNYQRDDDEINSLPKGLRDKIISYLPTLPTSFKVVLHSHYICTYNSHIIERERENSFKERFNEIAARERKVSVDWNLNG